MTPTNILKKYNFDKQLNAYQIQNCQKELANYTLDIIKKSEKTTLDYTDVLKELKANDSNYDKVDNKIVDQEFGSPTTSLSSLEAIIECGYKYISPSYKKHYKENWIDALQKEIIPTIMSKDNIDKIKEDIEDKLI